jgi:hypothetical protein
MTTTVVDLSALTSHVARLHVRGTDVAVPIHFLYRQPFCRKIIHSRDRLVGGPKFEVGVAAAVTAVPLLIQAYVLRVKAISGH